MLLDRRALVQEVGCDERSGGCARFGLPVSSPSVLSCPVLSVCLPACWSSCLRIYIYLLFISSAHSYLPYLMATSDTTTQKYICCPPGKTCHASAASPSGIYCCAPDDDKCIHAHADASTASPFHCAPGLTACDAEHGGGCCPAGSECAVTGCLWKYEAPPVFGSSSLPSNSSTSSSSSADDGCVATLSASVPMPSVAGGAGGPGPVVITTTHTHTGAMGMTSSSSSSSNGGEEAQTTMPTATATVTGNKVGETVVVVVPSAPTATTTSDAAGFGFSGYPTLEALVIGGVVAFAWFMVWASG
ncbi:hypothetical protein F4780DRAFT_722164 [Xylariomycetidae sp. FL0641]|nr:hypothetical protein F4780DRAFT_722164 [Xylariomycetidae sp. FL0641]